MVKLPTNIIFILFLFSNLLLAQQTEEISKKSAELSQLKNDINNLEKALKNKTEEERKSHRALKNLSEQGLLINKLIGKLVNEEKRKENEISSISKEIASLKLSISKLQEDYSRYITWLYKQGSGSTLKYLLNAESINQALIRYKHLSYITEKNKEALEKLETKILKYQSLQNKLNVEISDREALVLEKQKEQERLSISKKEKEKLIKELKEDQSALEKEIADKRMAEVSIKKIIDRLNEEERRRKELLRTEKLKNKKLDSKLEFNYDKYENFASLKGKLSWPIEKGKISRGFGENKNRRLNTVTINYGVDISTSKSSAVYCVAEGKVSAIDWIPGYGSIVIITHKGNYRTVYGHLSDIMVNEGDELKGGNVLGKVEQSLEGNILHFEIWNERNYLNPNSWLVKK